MDPTQRFTRRADDYARFRPRYAPAAIAKLRDLGMGPGHRVLDIGSGTGIWGRQLLETGAEVVGLEPNQAMREHAHGFETREGTAEATGEGDQSADWITAAQAFHWFDREPTAREWRRVLRPGGRVALIWNSREDMGPLIAEVNELLRSFWHEVAALNSRWDQGDRIDEFLGAPAESWTFSHDDTLDWEAFLGRCRSASYWPNEADERQAEAERRLAEIFTRYAESDRIQVPYRSKLFVGAFGPAG